MKNLSCPFCVELDTPSRSLFAELTRGKCAANRFVLANDGFVVFPPLGQFVEGGLLLITREHIPSFAKLRKDHFPALDSTLRVVCDALSECYRCRPVIFEHGPPPQCSKDACCVDHAHFNVFPVSINLHAILEQYHHQEIDHLHELPTVVEGREYLFVQHNDQRKVVYFPPIVPSQYVRRLITRELCMPERWHWRDYLGESEINCTVNTLKASATFRKLQYEEVDIKSIAERWDSKAGNWDSDLGDPECHLNEDKSYERFIEAAEEIIISKNDMLSQGTLLDYGCGTGIVVERLAKYFAHSIGLDISQQMLAVAEAKAIRSTSFVLGDCFSPPLESEIADVITSRGVLLSHYGKDNANAMLKTIHSLLKKNGIAVVDALNAAVCERFQHKPQGKTLYSAADLTSLAVNAGYSECQLLGETEKHRCLIMVVKK